MTEQNILDYALSIKRTLSFLLFFYVMALLVAYGILNVINPFGDLLIVVVVLVVSVITLVFALVITVLGLPIYRLGLDIQKESEHEAKSK